MNNAHDPEKREPHQHTDEHTADPAPDTTEVREPTGPPTVAHAVAPDPAAPPSPSARQRLRDRMFRFRSVLAVATAALVLGAAGGVGVAALVDHDGPRPGSSWVEGPGRGDAERRPGGSGFVPPLPPGTTSDPESGAGQAPSSGGTDSSGT